MTVYYKLRQMLLQNATDILLQNATKVYYKMRQVFYYKMQQFYYKIRRLLQNATFITNCDSTIRKAKKTQTSMKLRKVHQQMIEFSLMKIHQLLQIRLQL